MSGLRAALRIARRDAARSKGRSALVVAMVGVPMLALSFAGVAVRTGQVPPAEAARREIGAADLTASFVVDAPLTQYGLEGLEWPGDRPSPRPEDGLPDVRPVLPPGSRFVERERHGAVELRGNGRAVLGEVERIDLHDPLADGLVVLRAGALPRAADEVAVSERTARELGVAPGGTVTTPGVATRFRITGVVVVPASLPAQTVFVPLAAPLPSDAGRAQLTAERSILVDLPPGARDTDYVLPLNELGFRVIPRSWFFQPPPEEYDSGVDAQGLGVIVVVAGLAALEIVLLAGTAFAVGARRRRRELALIAATGGDRRDVRRVVLAGAAVLGAVAGALAVAGGILAVVLLRPVLERLSGTLFGPLDVRPLELGAIVLLATGTAVLAALLPARAASRFPVIAGLTGRRGDTRLRKRFPAIALAAIGVGTGLAFWAARQAFEPKPIAEGVVYYEPGNLMLVVLAGAVIAELGFVGCAPAAVTLVGRLASRLPLTLRLAARDAARHRTRSGPAVAAVVAAVAGSVALSVYLASDTAKQRREYEPFLTAGGVRIGRVTPTDKVVPDDAVAAAVAALPARARVDTYSVSERCDPDGECGAWWPEVPEQHRCADGNVTCARRAPMPGEVRAGSPALIEVSTGRTDERAQRAMREGRAVVFDPRLVSDGHVTVVREKVRAGRVVGRDRIRVPAVVFETDRLGEAPAVVLTPETARRHGLPLVEASTYVLTSRMPTGGEEAAARGALAAAGPYVDVFVERGFVSDTDIQLVVLVLAAGFVTLAATGIATGLAAADSRPDLATLAAVGAAPRVRRRLVMAQAATVSLLGSGLGVLAGIVPAAAIVSGQSDFPVVLPWGTFALNVVGIPVVTALLVGAFTRSRLPLERRVA